MISVKHDLPAATTDRLLTAEEFAELPSDGRCYDLMYGVNDTAAKVQLLIDLYLQGGASLVWIIHPIIETVEVYRADGTVARLGATDTLDGEAVLPGFALPVATLFE
jgi:Uma2 family endonuclease